MGNYVSCTLSTPGGVLGAHNGRSRQCCKVILPGGEVRSIVGPTKAAEIMMERPSFFLVNSRGLRIGRRLSALGADDDLETANVYVMLPMKRLNSVATAADMGAMFLAAAKKKKKNRRRGRGKAGHDNHDDHNDHDDDFFYNNSSSSGGGGRKIKRILPAEEEGGEGWPEDDDVSAEEKAVPKLNLEDIEDFSAPEFMHRLSMSRSKKPLLETIEEDQPVCLLR